VNLLHAVVTRKRVHARNEVAERRTNSGLFWCVHFCRIVMAW